MLSTYEKIRVPDENKQNDLILEVNWEPKNKELNECKFIRVIFPDKKTAVIKKEHFLAFLWMIGDPVEQRKMVPQKISTVRWYETVLSVIATKDIAKGEKMTFPIKLSLPSIEQEAIGELRSDVLKTKKSFLT